MDKARGGARTALAIASLVEQKAKYKFTTEDIEELTSKAKDAARSKCRRLYDYICYRFLARKTPILSV